MGSADCSEMVGSEFGAVKGGGEEVVSRQRWQFGLISGAEEKFGLPIDLLL